MWGSRAASTFTHVGGTCIARNFHHHETFCRTRPVAISLPIDLRNSRCSAMAKPRRTSDQPVRTRVALVLAAGLLTVTAFQIALTSGAPFGAAALGGTHPGNSQAPSGS